MTAALSQKFGITLSLLLVCLPHAEHLPAWASAVCAMLFCWHAYLAWTDNRLPPKWLLAGISIAAAAGIYIEYHTLFGRDAGVTLLILLSSLKLLELRSARDATVMIYLACFIIITNFFYSQSIPTAIYMLITLLVIITVWIGKHTGTLAPRPRAKLAFMLMLQAIPLTLLLFVLFPRVQGPLWGMPQDAFSQSGLSDTMTPGSLSRLTLSQAVAYRVAFDGPPPTNDKLYWRGPVLWEFDGITWSPGTSIRNKLPDIRETASPVSYTVTLEPSSKNWLFALEMPSNISVPSRLTDDFQTLSRTPVNARLRYSATSQLTYRANEEENTYQLQRALKLPSDINPMARKLAAEWRSHARDDGDTIINLAISRFNREGYAYTLEPPLLSGSNAIDDFLFNTRQGFCEHYASAFVFLMRAAGIPARVVTGYQGGEYSAIGDYFIIRQSDAHAWAEVWLKGQGWKRVDPTAAISPERISNGLTAAMPDSPALPLVARFRAPWLLKLRFNLDLLNYQWNQWVLGYNPERQFALLTRMGMEDASWKKMGLSMLAGLVLLVALYALLMLSKMHQRTDAAHKLYQSYCRKLARKGLIRSLHEGPMDFARRAIATFPEQASTINAITRLYIALRYARPGETATLSDLRHAIQSFRI